jgi:hypothetical protein
MAIDLVKLKVEITNNPARYQGLDDEGIAALLAVVDQDVPRENMDGGLLVSCISKAEFTALPAADKEYVRLIASTATPIPITAAFKAELVAVFGAGPTKNRLVAAASRKGTRAELLSLGGQPTASDVANAKRLL